MPLKLTKKIYNTHPKGHTKTFQKAYWPYLPLLTVSLAILSASLFSFYNPDIKVSSDPSINSEDIINNTNELRTSLNMKELAVNAQLTKLAEKQATNIASSARTTSLSAYPHDNEASPKVLGDDQTIALNTAFGFSNASQITRAWKNNPINYDKLTSPSFTEIGVAEATLNLPDDSKPSKIVVAIVGGAIRENLSTKSPAKPIKVKLAVSNGIMSSLALKSLISIGLIIGLLIAVKHSLNLKRILLKSKKLIVHHPLIDISVILLLALIIYLSKTSGFIT